MAVDAMERDGTGRELLGNRGRIRAPTHKKGHLAVATFIGLARPERFELPTPGS